MGCKFDIVIYILYTFVTRGPVQSPCSQDTGSAPSVRSVAT